MPGQTSTVCFFFPLSSLFHCFFLSSFLGPKGVTYGILIRLGVLWGKGTAGLEKGTFGSTWGCHSSRSIEDMYKRLRSKLKSDDIYAPFDALSILIGERNARIFSRDHLALYFRPTTNSASSSNPHNSDLMDVDN
jgi:hypothetical protein